MLISEAQCIMGNECFEIEDVDTAICHPVSAEAFCAEDYCTERLSYWVYPTGSLIQTVIFWRCLKRCLQHL